MSRVALVTGAARRIGRTIALRLAAEGYVVALHASARSLGEAQRLAAEIGAGARAFAADLANSEATRALVPSVAAALGAPTLLVNNASLFQPDAAAPFDEALFERHMAVNLRAPLTLCAAFADALGEDEEGAIVNVIDQRVWRPDASFFSYTLSKSALWSATRTMALSFAPRIRVNAVGPGPTLPNAFDGDAGLAREAARAPLRRAVDPADIAEAVSYLARAKNVTGQMIAVDAGQHLG